MKNRYLNFSFLSLLLVLMFGADLSAQTTVTIQATGTAGTFNTGSVNAAGTKNDGDMITINSSSNRGWAEFDLSSIPATAVVSAVTANFTTYSSTLSSAINNLYGFTGDPAVIPGTTLYTNCASGPSFNATSWSANALQSKVLNAAGIAFVDANCGGAMCIGYVRGSTNTYNIAGYPNVNGALPELVITYTVPTPCSGMPNAGTATISSSTGCPGVLFNLGATGVTADSGITYQWQSGPSPTGPWTNIVGATTVAYSTSTTSTTYYQLVTTCGVSGLSNTSSVVSYTVVNPGPCICSAYTIVSASSTADEDLGNVQVGTLNNTTTCASIAPGAGTIQNRYSNYAGNVAAPVVQQGQTIAYSLSSITCGGNFNNGFQIYIDYNQNGSFADPGEQAYSSAASVAGPHTESGTFTIPLTATVGVTRMRVISVETTFPTATNYAVTGYTWGETEDYCIDIIAPVPCSGTPAAGTATISSSSGCPNTNFNLNSTGYTLASGITFQWQTAPTATGPWTNTTGTNPSYTTSTTATAFYQLIVTCTNSGVADTSNIVSYTVVNPGPCICSAYTIVSASSTADEDLGNVTVGTMNNSSVCATIAPGAGTIQNRYSNYAGSVTGPSVQQGQSVNFSLSSITCGGNFSNGFQIYIDYNQNGSFADPGEQAYSSSASPAGPHTETGSFTVPPTATVGLTRMRVISVEGGFPTATNYAVTGYTWGETEDYCFTVIAPPPFDIEPLAFVNPTTTTCYTAADTVSVQITNNGVNTADFSVTPLTLNASVTGPNPMAFPPVTLTSGTLASYATMTVVITTSYNMSAAGTYVFSVNTNFATDGDISNDTLTGVTYTFDAGTATSATSTICNGSPANTTVTGYSPSNATFQWQSSPDNVTWTNIVGQTSATNTEPATLDTTYYRVIVCGLLTSTVDTVFTISVAPPTAVGDTICGFGNVTMIATTTGTASWYADAVTPTSFFTGDTLTTALAATDTFYVVDTYASFGSGNLTTAVCQPVYTNACTSNDYIDNFSTTGGITNITNNGSLCNGSLPSNNTFFPTQVHTASPGQTVNLSAQSGATFGQGFRLWVDYNNDGDFADAGEDVWNSGVSGTQVFTGSFVIPPTTAPGPKRMRLMCRWNIVPTFDNYCSPPAPNNSFGETEEYTLMVGLLCESPRVPVVGVVTPAPVVSATSSNNICGSGSSTLVAASSNSNYTYTWTPPATLNTTSGDTVLASPTMNTTYTVLGTDSATGCVDTASVQVMWGMAPAVNATVSDDTVCANTAVNLDVVSTTTNPIIVGTSNTLNSATSYPAPYGQFYWGSRHQMLILASELTALGMTPGYITALSFEIVSPNAMQPLDNFEIKMGATSVTSITTFQSPTFVSVFTAPTYMATTGVNTHTFSTPFFWDGVSNIIVETCHNNTSFTDNATFRQTVTPFSSTVYYRADASGVCANNTVTGSIAQRPNMRLWKTESFNYAWTPVANVDNPNIQNPIGTPTVSGDFIVTVTDSLNGCVSVDSVYVEVNPNPAPSFGPDTAICSNSTLLLDGTAGPYTYLWQDSTANQTYTVNSFGNYYVLVTDSVTGCIGTDSILVGINAAPSFTLGADATVCAGTQVSFSGPSGAYTYLWNTLDSTVSITVGAAGDYDVAVTDTANGCVGRDTVSLFVNPVPAVALGSDTSVCSASGSLTLTGPAGNYTYLWNTLDSSMSIAVNSSGTYYVTVTDTATSCYSGDTIQVQYNASPVANLGNDTTFCSANGPIILVGPAGPYNYVWNDMSTNMTLTTNTTGLYYVDVTDSLTGCTTTDSVMVNVPANPSFTLADSSFCGTQFTIVGPSGPFDYAWSTSDTTQSITVMTSGTYTLTVTDTTSGCTGQDQSIVNINANPTVTASASDLGPCADDANVILTGAPSGGTFTGTSVTGNQFDPSIGAGPYAVIYNFTDINGCSGADTLNILVDDCVGINEPFVGAGMNVYPNPNSGVFTFTAAQQSCNEMTIEVVTLEGQVIQSNKFSNVQGNFVQEINLTDFANGVYFMRVTTDGAVYMQRVVKQD